MSGWPSQVPALMRGGKTGTFALAKRARISLRSWTRLVGCSVVYYVSCFFGLFGCAVFHVVVNDQVPRYLKLSRERRDISINVRRSSCKVLFLYGRQIVVEILLVKCRDNPSSGIWIFHADRLTCRSTSHIALPAPLKLAAFVRIFTSTYGT
jgi:hypothetical protein